MWVSTEAIRAQTIVRGGRSLQVGVVSTANGPPELYVSSQLYVSSGLFRHSLVPEAGVRRSLRVDDAIVTFDGMEIESTAPVHVHARVRVEAAPPRPVENAGAPQACGAPSATRTRLPNELAASARLSEDRVLGPGTQVIGGIPLDIVLPPWDEDPPAPGDLEIHSMSMAPTSILVSSSSQPQFTRADRTLLRIDQSTESAVRVRAFALPCARQAVIARIERSVYVWLSTVGIALVTVGPADRPLLTLQLSPDALAPMFQASSEHAEDLQPLTTNVGHTATLDRLRIEITDVRASSDTRRTPNGWSSNSGIPSVHVQVRISPE
jgi:hypothetical protein